MNKKKELLLAVLGIIGVLVVTIGVTYSLLRYMREGSTENSITTGKITFLYTETSFGRGIKLENAMPLSDTDGMKQIGDRNVFDFKITADTTNNVAIPYDVTVVKQEKSDLKESDVKIYIAEVNANVEEYGKIGKFDDDSKFPKYNGSNIERIIYKGKVPSNKEGYIQNLRLKMWISEDAEFSPLKDNDGNYIIENDDYVYPNNNKTFKVKVNVYASGGVLTDTEVAQESQASMLSIKVDKEPLTETASGSKLYETILPSGTTETEVEVVTENEYQKVKIEKTQSDYSTVIGMNNDARIEKMSSTKKLKLPLTDGDNYFKISIIAEDGKTPTIYKLHINVFKIVQLYEKKQGDYVAYVGNNGCRNNGTDTTGNGVAESKNSCLGWNANQTASDTTAFGYCTNAARKYTVYGWRIAYVEGENAYLISAGSPECNLKPEKMGNTTYITNANIAAKKYCNSNFVDNCSSDSDVHAINNTDYNKITKQLNPGTGGGYLFETIDGATKCGGVSSEFCGSNNDLLSNGGLYWFAAAISASGTYGVEWNLTYPRFDNNNVAYGLRPVIKISSSVYVTGGKGTMAEPYTIANN